MATNTELLFVDPNLLRRAEQQCRQRLERDPEDRAALRSFAELQRKLGNLEDAAAVYERLLRLDPGDQDARYLHALCSGMETPAPPSGEHASPFVLIRDFLPKEFHEGLVPFMNARKDTFQPALVGRDGQYKPEIRETLEYRGEWEGRRQFQEALLRVLPDVMSRLHLGQMEIDTRAIQISVRAYSDGHFYKAHMDAPRDSPNAHRIINFVYYFHRMPRPFTGGELVVFDTDLEADTYTRARFTRVVPEDNAIIFFPCPYYHSVLPVACPSLEFVDSRFTINGHLFRRLDTKPAAEAPAEPGAVAAPPTAPLAG